MDIIQVLIFIVIIVVAIVQQISKAGKEKKTPSPKEVLADMFPEIEQEACLVYLTNENQGLPYISYRQYAKLDSKTPILESRIERNKPLKKWSNAVLSDEEIDLLNRITNQYTTIAKLSDSAPGIVTGANNKFILTKEEVDQLIDALKNATVENCVSIFF